MAPRRRRHLPMTDEAFLDDPELVLIRPIPTADAVGGGENFDVRVGDKVGHKVGLIIRSYLQSDGRRRSLTMKSGGHPMIAHPIAVMMAEHDSHAAQLARLEAL